MNTIVTIMKWSWAIKSYPAICILVSLVSLFLFSTNRSYAQQFNSDSWLSKAHGTITIIPTYGQRSSMIMNTYSLFSRWEFTMAAYLYNNDNDPKTNDGYSASFYAKYMFYENKAQTGGAAVKFGTGMFPGTIDAQERVKDAFKTFWMNVPVTIPFFDNKLSWDIMPGASMTINYDETKTNGWAFTYSTRLAYYPWKPNLSIVGELFGSAGATGTIPEFKIGPRWEPSQYAVIALTYGQEFGGTHGAGFEIGIMLFTPPFACLAGCKTKKPEQ
ncbi:MAG TPA: hypothetical protein VMH01_10580 [Puia sp.]|nr:hypothetical protein [Puia sp.]